MVGLHSVVANAHENLAVVLRHSAVHDVGTVAILLLGNSGGHLFEAVLPKVTAGLVDLLEFVDVSIFSISIFCSTVSVDNYTVQATFIGVLIFENRNAHKQMGRNVLVHPLAHVIKELRPLLGVILNVFDLVLVLLG